jgi:hypothetical protein
MGQTDLLTEHETAELRRCSTRKLQRDRAEGRGCPYVRIDGRVFYRRQDLDHYIAAHVCPGELRDTIWTELQRVVDLKTASQLSGLSVEIIKRQHSDKITDRGIRVRDALMLTQPP